MFFVPQTYHAGSYSSLCVFLLSFYALERKKYSSLCVCFFFLSIRYPSGSLSTKGWERSSYRLAYCLSTSISLTGVLNHGFSGTFTNCTRAWGIPFFTSGNRCAGVRVLGRQGSLPGRYCFEMRSSFKKSLVVSVVFCRMPSPISESRKREREREIMFIECSLTWARNRSLLIFRMRS